LDIGSLFVNGGDSGDDDFIPRNWERIKTARKPVIAPAAEDVFVAEVLSYSGAYEMES